MSVLGLDVGTSTCKGLVLSQDGRLLAEHHVSYADAVRLHDGTAELPASVFWDSAVRVIRALAEKTNHIDPIEALAVSCHGETLIVTDEDGKPLTNAILSMDRRCVQESAELEQQLGKQEIYRITGSMMHPQFPIPKILWLRRHRPELGERVHYYSTADYIHLRLGFPQIVDCSIASRFGGFDIHARRWSAPILQAAGVREAQLSRPVAGGTGIGRLSVETATLLGLSEGVLLVAGGHDQPCAAVGMGVDAPHVITVSAGSYECAACATKQPLNDERGSRYGLNSYCHVLPERYITLAFFASGIVTQWYLDTFCAEEKRAAAAQGCSVYDLMDGKPGQQPTGICITPHIFGSMNPEWSEAATAKVSGLTANATKADLYRAVLEGTCCELDLNIRVLEGLVGKTDSLRMTGGGTRSAAWMRLRTEITGKKIEVLENGTDASCMGAAILAGIGCGLYESPEDAYRKIRWDVRRYAPQNPRRFDTQKAEFLKLHSPGLMDEIQ